MRPRSRAEVARESETLEMRCGASCGGAFVCEAQVALFAQGWAVVNVRGRLCVCVRVGSTGLGYISVLSSRFVQKRCGPPGTPRLTLPSSSLTMRFRVGIHRVKVIIILLTPLLSTAGDPPIMQGPRSKRCWSSGRRPEHPIKCRGPSARPCPDGIPCIPLSIK